MIFASKRKRQLTVLDKNSKWITFLFLIAIFYLATPYRPYYTVESKESIEEFTEATIAGSSGRRIALILLLVYSVITILIRTVKLPKFNGVLGWFILFFVIFVFYSIGWAEDKLLTLRRVVALEILWIGAYAVAIRFSYHKTILFAFLTTFLVVLLSFICESLLGTFDPINPTYRFSGVVHANVQALNCGLLLLTGFSLGQAFDRNKWFYLFGALIGCIFLFLTKSRTVFVAAVLCLIILMFFNFSKNRIIVLAFFLLIGACVSLLFFGKDIVSNVWELVSLESVGRQRLDFINLTGRIPVWNECIKYLAQRPIIGYGFGSFWTSARMQEISKISGWDVPNAHNGYLDIALDLGIVGIIFYIGILIEGFKRAWKLQRLYGSYIYASCFSIISFMLIINMLGSRATALQIPTFILYVILIKLSYDQNYQKQKLHPWKY